MFEHVGINVNYSIGDIAYSHELYIPGATLLSWVVASAKSALRGGGAPAKSGLSKDQAIPMHGFGEWVSDVGATRSKSVMYYDIAGRTIFKKANSFYVSDFLYSGDSDAAEGTIWKRGDGASYREFGKFMHAKQEVSAMESVVWSQSTASKLRMVLKGKLGVYAPKSMQRATDHGGAAKTDLESSLPLLAAAMFIAEPARNERAWPVGLMMLDLLGEQYTGDQYLGTGTDRQLKQGKFLTLQRALVHPSRLDDPKWKNETNFGTDTAPANWVNSKARVGKGSPKAQRSNQKLADKMKKPGSAAVEGIYSPSPKWSAGTKKSVDVANDYIQQKEVSIVSQWVAEYVNFYLGGHVVTAEPLGNDGAAGRQNALTSDFGGESAMRGFKGDLERVVKTELIDKRSRSFDTPGMLFR